MKKIKNFYENKYNKLIHKLLNLRYFLKDILWPCILQYITSNIIFQTILKKILPINKGFRCIIKLSYDSFEMITIFKKKNVF
jgi:hypothetical protein